MPDHGGGARSMDAVLLDLFESASSDPRSDLRIQFADGDTVLCLYGIVWSRSSKELRRVLLPHDMTTSSFSALAFVHVPSLSRRAGLSLLRYLYLNDLVLSDLADADALFRLSSSCQMHTLAEGCVRVLGGGFMDAPESRIHPVGRQLLKLLVPPAGLLPAAAANGDRPPPPTLNAPNPMRAAHKPDRVSFASLSSPVWTPLDTHVRRFVPPAAPAAPVGDPRGKPAAFTLPIMSDDERRQAERVCDWTLVAGAYRFRVYRPLLAARCGYFEALFSGAWGGDSHETTMQDVDPLALWFVLVFLMSDDATACPSDSLLATYACADMLDVPSLCDRLLVRIEREVAHGFSLCCAQCEARLPDIVEFAEQFGLEGLREAGVAALAAEQQSGRHA